MNGMNLTVLFQFNILYQVFSFLLNVLMHSASDIRSKEVKQNLYIVT